MTKNEQLALRTFVLLVQEEAELKLQIEKKPITFLKGAHWAFSLVKSAFTNDETAKILDDLFELYALLEISK